MSIARNEQDENKATPVKDSVVNDRRQADKKKERRERNERRGKQVPVAVDRRKGDRRNNERRRQVDPTTCERDYDLEEIEFLRAIEQYKKDFLRPFPTWSEVLEVLKSLGYRKVAEPTQIILNRAKARMLEQNEST